MAVEDNGADYEERIAWIRTDAPASLSSSVGFHRSGVFALLMLVAPLGFLLGVFFRWWLGYREQHVDRFRCRSAYGKARRELSKAKKSAASGDVLSASKQTAAAVRGYLAAKYDRSAMGLTLEDVESFVVMHGASESAGRRLREIMEFCDQAEYAPVAGGVGQLEGMTRDALSILESVEKGEAS
jgi:hypothetical protein